MLFAVAVTTTACGQWKSGGHEEAIPDLIGQATGVNRSLGVPSETLHTDRADEDIRLNRPSDEEIEATAKSEHPRTVQFEFAH
jgi:hypothetical protein